MEKADKRVFLELTIDQDTWQLSKAYKKVADQSIHFYPTIFILPWPSDMIPQVGSTFYWDELPIGFNKGTVKEIRHICSQARGIRIEVDIELDAALGSTRFDDHCLIDFAEEGFLFDSNEPIAAALKAAGLPATFEEFKEHRK